MRTRRAIVDALERDADAVVGDALERISAVPPYHAMSPEMRKEVAATVGWILRTFASCLRAARPMSTEEVAELRDFGMRRARVGIPLAAVTHAFEVAFEASQSALVRIATRIDPRAGDDVLPGLSAELFPLSREAIRAIEAGHGARSPTKPDRLLRERAALAEEILAAGVTGADLTQRAAGLGLTAGPSPELIVAIPTGSTPLAALGDATDELTDAVPDAVCGMVRKTPSEHAVVLGLAPMPANVKRLLRELSDRHHLAIVHAGGSDAASPGAQDRVGLNHAGVPAAYADVRTHLPIPCRLLRGPGVIALGTLRDLLPLAAIPEEVARREIARVLTPLPDAKACDRRLETLHVLIDAQGNTKRAAAILGINERTVRSRVQAAAAARGRTQSDPHDLHVLRRAIYLSRLHGVVVVDDLSTDERPADADGHGVTGHDGERPD